MANPTPPSSTPTTTTAFQQPPTLVQIQQKVRRLTRTPSTSQMTDAELNNYINTFVVYDFPEQLRTFNLRKSFTFYTNPGQDVYNTDIASFAGATTNILYNFQNLYLTVHPPFYVSGFQSFYSQSREQFFGIYPQVRNIQFTGQNGNGTPGPFTGVINTQQTLPSPANNQVLGLLQGHVMFDCVTATGEALTLVDVPVVNATTGYKTTTGNLYNPNSAAYQTALQTPPTVPLTGVNTINYLTGAYTITFSANTLAGAPINSQTVPQNLAIPQAVLYYNNQFTVRPVPDQSYPINFEVYQRPTALLATGQTPELEEYWQMIAYGASIKILQDRLDMESVNLIYPEYNNQLKLCLRRTLVQYSNERTSTIYTEQTSGINGWGGFYGGGQF